MKAGSRAGTTPAPAIDDDIFADLDDFVSIHDVPFVTVNRINGKYQAEVILCEDEAVNLARVQEALDVGYIYGVHAYARVHGEYGNVLIFFTADIIGGA